MDDREFAKHVRQMTDRLWRISYSMLRSGADADDAVQEALIRAWRGIGRLKEEAYFETWLTRILISECRRMFKKRPETSLLPDSKAARVPENHRALHNAIGLLPPFLRLPIVLYYMEGHSVKEVAGILRISESSAKARLFRARKQLKNELIKEAAEDEQK